MILGIIQSPDPVLRSLCTPVLEVSEEIKTTINDMYDTLYEASGRGLAGPQIGITNRLFVMDINWKNGTSEPVTMINPEILFKSKETQVKITKHARKRDAPKTSASRDKLKPMTH